MLVRAWFAVLVLLTFGSATARAQKPSVNPDAGALAEGWSRLAKGDAAGAAVIAGEQLVRDQKNTAALVLAVDADLARAGAAGGLTTYEKWLGTRRLDDAFVLRRVARATLAESTTKQTNAGARLEALKQLAADGDPSAASTLEQAAESNGVGEAVALAAIGNEQAVRTLLAHLQTAPGSKTRLIDALGDSGSKLAVAPLTGLLTDASDVNRAAAADALGRLGATESIAKIRPLLNDQVFNVKVKAAGALLRLNDSSGQPFLLDLTRSEHAGVRVAAARELAPQPDPSWQALVRGLTNDPDPLVRLDAARLIAPYDLPLANSVLDALMRDSNPGIREAASGVMVERVAASFAALRALLHSGDVMVRVRAAGRILELTR